MTQICQDLSLITPIAYPIFSRHDAFFMLTECAFELSLVSYIIWILVTLSDRLPVSDPAEAKPLGAALIWGI